MSFSIKLKEVEELDNTDGLSTVTKEFMVLLRMGCTNTAKCKSLSGALLDMLFRMYRVASRIDVLCDRYDVGRFYQVCRKSEEGNGSYAGNCISIH